MNSQYGVNEKFCFSQEDSARSYPAMVPLWPPKPNVRAPRSASHRTCAGIGLPPCGVAMTCRSKSECASHTERGANGIVVDEETWRDLEGAAVSVGIEVAEFRRMAGVN